MKLPYDDFLFLFLFLFGCTLCKSLNMYCQKCQKTKKEHFRACQKKARIRNIL